MTMDNSSPPLPIIYLLDASVAVTGSFVSAKAESKALARMARVVLVLPRGSAIPDSELCDFFRVEYIDIINIKRSIIAIIFYFPTLVVSSWRLFRMMRLDRAERLQLNDFYLMHGALCRFFGFRGKVVTWIRFDPRRFGAVLSSIWLGISSRVSDEIVSVSYFIQKALPIGMATRVVYEAAPFLDIKGGSPNSQFRRLIYLGNYIQGKGQDDAIAVFSRIADTYDDVILEFWGGDMGLGKNRAYKTMLEDRVKSLNLSERIHFGNFNSDVADVLQGGFAALNFSRSESFSMTVLEATTAGMPVIATRSGGPAEIVEDGVTGFLVDVGDIDAMVEAVRKLLEDNIKAGGMGEAGRRRAAECFGLSAFVENLREIFELSGSVPVEFEGASVTTLK